MVPLTRPAPPLLAARRLAVTPGVWVAAALFLAAAVVRLYRLGVDPLWYDEIISTLVVRRGLPALFANSLTDPHPPLYYLLLWLTSGFGAAQAEWAWRWPSALAGALSVPAFYWLARRTAGAGPAMLVAAWLVFNPTAVYFSQEARWPALTMLLAILLTLVFSLILETPTDRRRWVLYAGLAAVGLYTSYSFLLVVGVQLPFVVWALRRQRAAGWLALALLLPLAGIAALGGSALPAIAVQHTGTQPLTVKPILQGLLAGDVYRYHNFWPHKITVALVGLLAALGSWQLWHTPPRWAYLYPLAQLAVPLAAYGLVAVPLLHLNLPNFETRQFLVLLPALLLLAANGLALAWAHLPRWAAWGVGLLLSIVVITGSVQGLGRYWTITRSPEGLTAQYLAPQLAPGDALVALDYAVASALLYYLPDEPLFARPTITAAGLRFFRPDGRLKFEIDPTQFSATLTEVYAYPRLWVLSVPGRPENNLSLILAGCREAQPPTDISWLPVRVQLLTDCAVAPAP